LSRFLVCFVRSHELPQRGYVQQCFPFPALEDSGGRFGLQTMRESGGMANATLVERL